MDDPIRDSRVDLEAALEAFDATEANLVRLEKIRNEMRGLTPSGIAFMGDSPEGVRYQELQWAFDEVAAALPEIGSFRIDASPLGLDTIAQWRLDAAEIGEFQAELELDDEIAKPDRQAAEYMHRFQRARRELVREALVGLLSEVSALITALASRTQADTNSVVDEGWDRLQGLIAQIDRLVGGQLPKTKPWSDLYRHLRFGQGQDLHDIARADWPSVRALIQKDLYSDYEPIPVGIKDLATLAATKPRGPVTTALAWDALTDEGFERLIFNLISDAVGYENPQWLTKTNAPDRGRDLSVDRVRVDPLSGSVRERVIIQARHWLKHSVALPDISDLLAQVRLWEPPVVNAVIVATSGRFTTDAVDWIERHNADGERPRIDMWPESHLERLLAARPHLAVGLGLRA